MQGKMVRAGLAAALVLAPGPLAAQQRRPDDSVGTLVLHGPTEAQTKRMELKFVALGFGLDEGQGGPGRSLAYVVVRARLGRPDPAVLAWAADAEAKRRVTVEMRQRQGNARSRYELEGARLTGLDFSLSREEPLQTLLLRPEHMAINGRPVY